MYAAHFALGVALKAQMPKLSALPLVLGAGILDLLDGAFILLGFDRVQANPSAGPYLFFELSFIDWDHSLLMAALWSLAYATLFWKDGQLARWAAIAALSHLLLDLPVHNRDLALYPYSSLHFGYSGWARFGVWSWLLEGLLALAFCSYATVKNARRGVPSRAANTLVLGLFLSLSPWLSPMKWIAQLPEPRAHLLHGALVTLGFCLPALLLARVLNRGASASA